MNRIARESTGDMINAQRELRATTEVDEPMRRLLRLIELQEQSIASCSEYTQSLQKQVSALASCMWPPLHQASELEIVKDADRIAEIQDSIVELPAEEIMLLRPAFGSPDEMNRDLERFQSARTRGITVRCIQQQLHTSLRFRSYFRQLTSLGCQVRTSPLIPFQATVVDGTLSFISTDVDGSPEKMLLVTNSHLVGCMRRVFEFCWDAASDSAAQPKLGIRGSGHPEADVSRPRVPDLAPDQLTVLRLWASGRPDTAIARELQVSPRTLRRTTATLMRRLGVSTRFEAGMVAARSGLLN
ncbi:helix-turn-helix transcriptional regulator [Streptomyces viridochromogenes]|uniref:helix-turn-helix transcriptional regulator n=1 Tax=Streptomyces viridochromogenes TaxID=1938 RepID=UPI001319C837|nr:LuxR C-terminal-related transcriptional regulator [Streptomyces viridochromogenes]